MLLSSVPSTNGRTPSEWRSIRGWLAYGWDRRPYWCPMRVEWPVCTLELGKWASNGALSVWWTGFLSGLLWKALSITTFWTWYLFTWEVFISYTCIAILSTDFEWRSSFSGSCQCSNQHRSHPTNSGRQIMHLPCKYVHRISIDISAGIHWPLV